jgi:glucuronokinase
LVFETESNGWAVHRYGDKAIAPEMLKMVSIAQKHNAAAKFPGSGGAVVGMCRGDRGRKNLSQLRKEFEEEVR